MKTNVKEALLEGGRVVLLAVVSYLLTGGVVDVLLALVFGLNLDPNMKLIVSGLILSMLRSLDKWLHLEAKDDPLKTRNEGLLGTKGLSGF